MADTVFYTLSGVVYAVMLGILGIPALYRAWMARRVVRQAENLNRIAAKVKV
jgi:hypothetical protein